MKKTNLNTELIDLTKLLDGYEDKWVIIADDYSKIIKSANSVEELKDFTNKGIIMRVPNPNYIFVPTLI